MGISQSITQERSGGGGLCPRACARRRRGRRSDCHCQHVRPFRRSRSRRQAGGLLGREIKVVSFDTQTNMQLYAQYAQEAALKNKVAVVHGGITSASREVIRPVLDKYKTLYFYDMPYEGGVCDRNIFIDGLTPAHNTEVLVGHGMKNWGKKVYTLAADYNYGQITAD